MRIGGNITNMIDFLLCAVSRQRVFLLSRLHFAWQPIRNTKKRSNI